MKLDLAGDPSKPSVLELDGEELEALTHPYPLGSVKYHAGMFALSVAVSAVVAVTGITGLLSDTPVWALMPSFIVLGLHYYLAKRELGRWRRARIVAGIQLPPMPAAMFEGIRMQRRLAEAHIRIRRQQAFRAAARRLLPGR